MPVVVFVRHGESEANAITHAGGEYRRIEDPPLTDRGRVQAHETARHIADALCATGRRVTLAVWTSPQRRAAETAAALRTTDENERAECLRGSSRWFDITHEPALREYDGDTESWAEFECRVTRTLDELFRGEAEYVLVFTHSLWLSCAISWVASGKRAFPAVDGVCHQLPNCSLTVMERLDTTRMPPRIYKTACTAHLTQPTGLHTTF
jgi:broad specificity phosphatase PhoE